MLVGLTVVNSWLNEAATVINNRMGNFPFFYMGLPEMEILADYSFGISCLIELKKKNSG